MLSLPLSSGSLAGSSDVSLTTLGDDEILVSASGVWVNKTLAEAGISAVGHTHASSAITDFTEAVQDVIGAFFADSSTIDITYNDGANSLVADILAGPTLAALAAFTGDSGSGGAKGLVPAPSAGDATKFLRGDGTWVTAAGSGTVTSVAVSVPAGFSVSGSPITTSGTIAITADSAAANRVYATPDGSSGSPTIRALVGADLPVMVGDSGSGGTKGAVPAPAAGDYAAGKYLDAGGNYSVPPGSGGGGSTGWETNLFVNSSFQNWTHGATSTTAPTPTSFTAVGDHVYGGPGRWKFYRESVACQIKQVAGRSGYSSKAIEVKNASGGDGAYFALSQVLESADTLALRGTDVVASVWINPQTETDTYSLLLIEFTGTADSIDSDPFNDWSSDTISEGNLIATSANYSILGSATLSATSGSWQNLQVSHAVGSGANNIMAVLVLHGSHSLSNNASVQITAFGLYRGTTAPDYVEAPYAITERDCLRWHVCMTGAGISDFYKSGRKVLTNRVRAFYDALPVPMRSTPTITNNVSGWTAGAPGTTTIAGYDEMGSAYLTITGALTFLAAAYDRFRWTAKAEAGTSFSGTTGNYVEMAFGEDVVLHFDCSL